MVQKKIKGYKVAWVCIRSWFLLILAVFAMVAAWLLLTAPIYLFAKPAIRFVGIAMALSLGISLLLFIFNEPLVVLMTGAKRIRKREASPMLWDSVNRVAPEMLSRTPRIYLIEESGMNAFAFGAGLPFLSAVGATQGIIKALDKEELDAVMAHEMGHIANKDMMVSITMTFSVMTMAFTGWCLYRLAPLSLVGSSEEKNGEKKGKVILICIIIGAAMYYFGKALGCVLQLFVSRQREYVADAKSARYLGTGDHLISALEKISRNPHFAGKKAEAFAGFLCTADPDPSDLLSTHPSLENRIKALKALE
jgi:heat shock protein HtpX